MFRPVYDSQPLRVVSTERLRREIAGHTLATPPPVSPKPLSRVPAFDRWRGYVRAFDMLQLLGQALTPMLPSGYFEASTRWAFYRYFWAFAPALPAHPLRLSEEASRLVDHHRTLASEQLGIGATLLLARWLVQRRHPGAEVDFADADFAVDRGSVDAAGTLIIGRVPTNRRMRPDYFFTARERSSGQVTVYAVEAKGTHTPRYYKTR